MAILINKDSRIIVQGITGSEGSFHAAKCLDYAGNIVGGVTPGKGGQRALDGRVPVFNTVEEARAVTKANVSLVFVPAIFCCDAICEAANAGIELIVCITEGIPVQDMIKVNAFVKAKGVRLVGPNSPGILTPGEAKVGIIPGFIAKKGCVGVMSKSGTLTYEAISQLCDLGIGQSTCIGIGGDQIVGTDMTDLAKLFQEDSETQAIVMIGEIGGTMEIDAAEYIRDNVTKPVISFISGQTAPPGIRMGHAGAIVSGKDESAIAKKAFLKSCGVIVVDSPADIGTAVQSALAEVSLYPNQNRN
jgi:succinyl-CoA synthetase alpha subunit